MSSFSEAGEGEAPTLPNVVTGATKGGNGKYLKTVIYDAQGRIASAVVEGTIGGTTPSAQGSTGSEGSSEAVARVDHVHPGLSIFDVWRAEAAADLGIAASGLVFLMAGDLVGSQGTNLTNSGGTSAVAPDGWGKRLQTGGGANGVCTSTFSAFGGATPMAMVFAGAAFKFWFKARMAINKFAGGPVGAATVLGIAFRSTGVANGTHELVCGVDGAVSTTNFIVTATAGSTMDSGVPIDSNVRDHKIVRVNGTDTLYYIDDVLKVTGNARPNANSHGCLMAFDSAAVAQECYMYLQAMAFPVRALGV